MSEYKTKTACPASPSHERGVTLMKVFIGEYIVLLRYRPAAQYSFAVWAMRISGKGRHLLCDYHNDKQAAISLFMKRAARLYGNADEHTRRGFPVNLAHLTPVQFKSYLRELHSAATKIRGWVLL